MKLKAAAQSGPRLLGLVLIALCSGWVLGVEVLYHELSRPNLGHPLGDALAGWALAVVTGLLLGMALARWLDNQYRARVLLGSLEQSARSIELLTDPDLALLPMNELLDEMLDRAARIIGTEIGLIYLLTESGDELLVRVSRGAEGVAGGGRVPVGKGAMGQVAASGKPLILNQVGPGDIQSPALQGLVKSLVAAPLGIDGRLIGVIGTASTQPARFGPADLRLLQLVADRVAAAVERARLDEARRRSGLSAEAARRQLLLLGQAGEILAEALDDYEAVLDDLGRMVVSNYADWFSVHLAGGGDNARDRRSWYAPGMASPGPAPDENPAWRELIHEVLTQAQPRLLFQEGPAGGVVDEETPGRPGGAQGHGAAAPHPALLASGLQSLMVVPIRVRGLSFGVLGFGTRGGARRGYRPSDLSTGLALAQRVATAVERVLLYRETQAAEKAATSQASQLRRLMEAALTVNRPRSEAQIRELVADQARRVMGAERAVVAVGRGAEAERAFSPAGGRGRAVPALEEMTRATGRSARGAEGSELAQYLTSEEAAANLPDTYWLTAPLRDSNGQPLGCIYLIGSDRDGFSPEDESILVSMAQMASASLANASLYEEVQANSRRLQTLMESAPLAIVELDLEGTARWWNRAAAELFAWDPDSTGSHSLSELDDATAPELSRLWYRAVSGRASVGVEVSTRRGPRGSELFLSLSTAPIQDGEGTVTGVMALMEDVTERRMMEEQFHQAERLDAMGRLAGGVAHDFNNLVTVILGCADLLRRRIPAGDPKHEDLDAITRAGQRAATLTGQLLAVGRRELGNPVVVDAGEVIAGMETMLRTLTGTAVELNLHLEPSAGKVLLDPAQLERIILNLAINARDAMTEKDCLSICVDNNIGPSSSGRPAESVAGAVRIEIRDTGHGMDQETLEHCFDPFFTTKERSKGTGLGLAAVHGIVTQAGGNITVASHPGEGTTFTILLPALSAETEGKEQVDAGPGTFTGQEDGTTILLVEDEDELRAMAVQHLQSLGYQVFTASDGTKGLALATTLLGKMDLLVTDVTMPGMTGIELARRLARLRANVPILFISGYYGDNQAGSGRLPKGANLLPKPFSPDQLAERVKAALDRVGVG